jgi:hypothetical protein
MGCIDRCLGRDLAMSVGSILDVRLLGGMNRGYNEEAALGSIKNGTKDACCISRSLIAELTFATGIEFVVRR